MTTKLKSFFKWYWEHIKSAYSFGGYIHPLDATRNGQSFWKTEWRMCKSLFIVAMLPQLFILLLGLAAVGFFVLIQ